MVLLIICDGGKRMERDEAVRERKREGERKMGSERGGVH